MRERAKRLAQRTFRVGDRIGVHVLPAHYYSPVASRRVLRRTEAQWRRPLSPMPFRWDLDAQARWLTEIVGDAPTELAEADLPALGTSVGGFRFGALEAQFLHCWLRRTAPRRVIEIGSGGSTVVMSRAVERNVAEGRPATEIVAFDPYYADRVAALPHVRSSSRGGAQLGLDDLGLTAGDLVFIDSTHTVRTGSELVHLYLELLPALPADVTVHVHDIYLPYLFAPDVYENMFDWQETVLVAALLANNPRLEILAAMSGLAHDRPEVLRDAFPGYRPARLERGLGRLGGAHFPSSLWLRTVAT